MMIGLLGTYPYQTLAALFLGCIVFRQSIGKVKKNNPKGLPLPPGPKGYPLIGNLFDFPIVNPWLVYQKWCNTYGDIIYFNVLGRHFVVLGSLRRITDLLEQRSANYSDRTRMPMLMELMGWDFTFAFMPYGIWWKKHRRTFQEYFHANELQKYIPIQRQEIHAFLRRLLVTPDDFVDHINHLFGATIMKISYGIDIQESKDPYILVAEEAVEGIHEAGVPGAFWVDVFPVLKYVPSWFPGASFQKKAARWREVNKSLIEKPFCYVKEQLKNGDAAPSMAADLIERLPDEGDPQRLTEEKVAQEILATSFLGGYDTTSSTVQALFLAMALYPEVQEKAQAEIDAIIGPDRLPDFEDRHSLSYINAVVKETMRWHLVSPLAVPHMATNDDEYDGYYIPKGTIVLGNSWSILHNPKTFDNPMEYRPDRYLKDGKLNPDMMDPDSVAFGFGRRICPGRHFSNNSLYMIASCLLAVYDIKPPVDDQGNTIKLTAEFTSGLGSFPAPFKCIIKPRAPAAEALIRGSVYEEL